jgi:hypothetical protein
MTFMSNYHSLPKKIWHTSMGITSHIISSLYPPILNSTKHCLVTITYCPLCNHETLYGFGCVVVSISNLSTIYVDIKLSVLPLSIITLHTLSLVLKVVLKRLFLCTGLSTSAFFLREPSSTSVIFHHLLLLLQHLFSMLLKCELHLLLIYFSRDIPKTCVLSFHRHSILLLLLLFFIFL